MKRKGPLLIVLAVAIGVLLYVRTAQAHPGPGAYQQWEWLGPLPSGIGYDDWQSRVSTQAVVGSGSLTPLSSPDQLLPEARTVFYKKFPGGTSGVSIFILLASPDGVPNGYFVVEGRGRAERHWFLQHSMKVGF